MIVRVKNISTKEIDRDIVTDGRIVWSNDDYRQLVILHNKYLPIKVIAKMMGKTYNGTSRAICRLRSKGVYLKQKRLWTNEETNRLIQLVNSGIPIETIAIELDRSETTIATTVSKLRKEGLITFKRYTLSWEENVDEINNLYEEGLAPSDIANRLGIEVNQVIAIRSWAVKKGLIKPLSLIEKAEIRFLSSVKLDTKNGHWLWVGRENNFGGYGRFTLRGKSIMAHRWSYIHWNNNDNPIPKGLVVRHMCHTPSCVNPKHLKVGTQKENMGDRKDRVNHG